MRLMEMPHELGFTMPRSARRCLVSLLLVALSLVCVTARAQEPTAEETKIATQEYLRGRAALDAKQFDKALEHFRKSYDTVKSPNSRFMLARTLEEMGKKPEAYNEAKGAVREADQAPDKQKYADTAKAAREMVRELSKEVALVSLIVDAPADSTLRIDDREIDRADWNGSIALEPGSHTAVLETPSQRYEKQIDVKAGEGTTLVMPPKTKSKASDDSSSDAELSASAEAEADTGSGVDPDTLRTAAFVSYGVGAVGWIMFGVFGGLALSTFDDLEESCGPSRSCLPEQQEDADRGSSFQTAANVGLAFGIIGVAAGTGLLIASFVIDDPDEDEKGDEEDAKLLVGPGYVGVHGSF